MFSDGYQDQFGGKGNKKFMGNQFKKMLLDNHKLPMHSQLDIVESRFDEWKGNNKQIDDVLVIGINLTTEK